FAALVLVDRQRVADIGANGDVVDIEDRQFVKALVDEAGQQLLVQLVTSFGINLASLQVDQIFGDIHAVEVFIDGKQVGQAVLGKLLGLPSRELLAAFMHDVAGLGVDQVVG